MAPPETKLPVAEIVRQFEEGETAVDLAKEYGCGYSTLQKAIYYFRNAAIVLTPPVVHDESTGYYLDAAGHRFTRAELLRYMSAVRERERIERAADRAGARARNRSRGCEASEETRTAQRTGARRLIQNRRFPHSVPGAVSRAGCESERRGYPPRFLSLGGPRRAGGRARIESASEAESLPCLSRNPLRQRQSDALQISMSGDAGGSKPPVWSPATDRRTRGLNSRSPAVTQSASSSSGGRGSESNRTARTHSHRPGRHCRWLPPRSSFEIPGHPGARVALPDGMPGVGAWQDDSRPPGARSSDRRIAHRQDHDLLPMFDRPVLFAGTDPRYRAFMSAGWTVDVVPITPLFPRWILIGIDRGGPTTYPAANLSGSWRHLPADTQQRKGRAASRRAGRLLSERPGPVEG